MPRRKPEKVIEYRVTLGDLEREILKTNETTQIIGAGAALASGLGLFLLPFGIVGAAGLAAALWGDEAMEAIDKLKDWIIEDVVGTLTPEGTGEFIASMHGFEDPIDFTVSGMAEPAGDATSRVGLEGYTIYEAYAFAATTRWAEWEDKMNFVHKQMTNFRLSMIGLGKPNTTRTAPR